MMVAGWAWIGTDTVPGAEHMVAASAPALMGWLYMIVADNNSPKILNFYEDVKSYGGKYFDSAPDSVDVYSASLYDAVYLFAHAATRVIHGGGASNNGTALVEAMRGLTFKGALEILESRVFYAHVYAHCYTHGYAHDCTGAPERDAHISMHIHIFTHGYMQVSLIGMCSLTRMAMCRSHTL